MVEVFWPQCRGLKGLPRDTIFQYYYPKFVPAAEKHGQGINNREIVWAQDQLYKLYRDGVFYATSDRYEKNPISKGSGTPEAEKARVKLQASIDSMPQKAAKLLKK